MVCFSKQREAQEAITEIKWHEDWNPEVYRNLFNQSTGKISSICEDKQEHKTNKKKKSEGDLEKKF